MIQYSGGGDDNNYILHSDAIGPSSILETPTGTRNSPLTRAQVHEPCISKTLLYFPLFSLVSGVALEIYIGK
jgi:hypothetical protein